MNPNELRHLLRDDSANRPVLRPAAEFWSAFERRAEALGPQSAAAPAAFRWASWKAGPLLAAAAAAVAAVWVGLSPGPGFPGAVHSYQIGAHLAHRGVMILDDAPSHATILWIVDCSENGSETVAQTAPEASP